MSEESGRGSPGEVPGVRGTGGSVRAPEGPAGDGQPGGPVAAPRRGPSPGAEGLRRGVRLARGAPCSGDGMGRGRAGAGGAGGAGGGGRAGAPRPDPEGRPRGTARQQPDTQPRARGAWEGMEAAVGIAPQRG